MVEEGEEATATTAVTTDVTTRTTEDTVEVLRSRPAKTSRRESTFWSPQPGAVADVSLASPGSPSSTTPTNPSLHPFSLPPLPPSLQQSLNQPQNL